MAFGLLFFFSPEKIDSVIGFLSTIILFHEVPGSMACLKDPAFKAAA